MRPLRLEVEGFACYRDRQPVLEFSELTLFAIAGPTGAGKSSILDAMLYALFGEVPRIGKQGVAEFISQGRDRMSVTLDFRVRNRDYRVTRASRQLKSSAKTDATLAELTTAGERSIASQVKPVNDAIVELLGLGYDELIQTVVLPQGEFAKFLKAKPADQRSILQHLLRHDVFTRMRDLAEERRRDIDARLRGLDGQLSTYADATEEALAARERELIDARERQAEAASARDAADRSAQDARRLRDLTQQVEQLRSQRITLEKEAANVERARLELDLARRASAILPRLEAFKDSQARLASARSALEQATTTAERASEARSRAAERAERASTAARECDALSSRLRRLDEIAGDVARRTELASSLEASKRKVTAAERTLKAAREREDVSRKEMQHQEVHLRDLQAASDSFSLDEDLLAAIEGNFESVGKAKALQQEISSLESEAEHLDAERAGAEAREQDARTACDRAQSAADAANQRLQEARAALDDGRDRDRAAALRAHLHAGDSCPVCLQTVVKVPEAVAAPELALLEAALKKAEEQASRADKANQTAAAALAKAVAKREQAAKAAEAVAAKLAERRTDLSSVLRTLSSVVAAGSAVEGPAVLVWMEERRAQLRSAKAERDRRAAGIREAEEALTNAKLALKESEAAAARASDERERQVQEHARLHAELEAVVARIGAVSADPDPLVERERIAGQISALREAERQAARALADATAEAARADAALQAAKAALADASAQVSAMEDALTQALSGAGFDSAGAAAAAVRPPAQQKALEAQVTAYDEKRTAVMQRLAELEPQVGGKEMSADTLAEIERQAKAAAEASRLADQAAARLELEVTRLRTAVKERAALVAQQNALRKTYAITAELAADLKSDRFQEYLLEEAFKTLVAGASVRLKAISNRYTLQWESGEFYVVDHDNAGERRRAETLSGGETFMASLCLALQLSEEVLRTSGALQMDSLFIDEGFGTLDSDSLSEVTDAMEALRQDRDRMIGVISHRPELTDRLPGCIRVKKGVGESSWALERVG